MGRAIAHGRPGPVRFDDPTAFDLLPDGARARVERVRSGAAPQGLTDRAAFAYFRRQATLMMVRTMAIDEAIRAARSPQLVILGAGLDGRAWRMPELCDVTVFEVDHPDTQRDKRARAARLEPRAKDIRFVPVDFERGSLDDALAAAGHDPARATTWVWEGVVMYLTPSDVEATLDVVRRRSAPHSRLVVVYHSPAPLLKIVGPILHVIGEPLRSTYTDEAMQALLEARGFRVASASGLSEFAATLSPELATATKVVNHQRIATADCS